MDTVTTPHTERQLLTQLEPALMALAEKTALKARIVPPRLQRNKHPLPDALIDIEFAGKKHRYAVEAKTHVDRLATLGHIQAQARLWDEPALLFAPYITTAIAKHCRELDLPFLDTAGNAYLRLPDMFIYITGEKPGGRTTTTIRTRTGGTATALRVMFALLCNPELLNAPYRDIVKTAGVALGAVGWVFFDLQKRGYIVGNQRKRNRRLIDPMRLLEEWVTNYPIKLRPKLNPRRFRAEDPMWWREANLADIRAYWGGEVAAHRLTKHLKPATFTIYVEPRTPDAEPQAKTALTQFVGKHRLRADPHGNIEILDAFWNLPRRKGEADVVPPILAYADLVATNDARNIDAARLVRERYIDHALRPG
jgi:hypothetical protein